MLKLNYESKSEIPEGLEAYYAEKDGAFVLQAEGLKTDNDVASVKNALDKERKARREAEAKVKDFENKYSLLPDDFDIDEFNRLKDTSQGDIDAKLKEQRERITEQHTKELSKLQEQLQEKDSLVSTHVKTATLQRAMAENNIAKPFMPAVEAMMKDKITVEGGDVFLNEKPVSDALKEWANSDEGKHYVSAPQNSGGGSNESKSGNGAVKAMNSSEFNSLPPKQQAKLMSSGVTLTD